MWMLNSVHPGRFLAVGSYSSPQSFRDGSGEGTPRVAPDAL